MAAQSELNLAGSRPSPPSARTRVHSAAHAVLLWTPFWVPLVFLCQLLALGLFRAGAEAERLDGAEREVRTRVHVLEEERDALEAQSRMLSDEVYQERVRRRLLDPVATPLTLENAQRAAKP